MTTEVIRPRRLPSRSKRLQSIDHGVRNLAQPVADVAELVVELAHVPKQLTKLAENHEELRKMFSGERRAYAGEHATDQAEIRQVKEGFKRLEAKSDEQAKAIEKLGSIVYKAAGALGALGSALALIKFLIDTRH